MIAGIHLGLNLDYLPVPRNAVGIHLEERIPLAKGLDKRIDLLCLERAIKRHFTFSRGLLHKGFLALLGRHFCEFGQNLTAVSAAGAAMASPAARHKSNPRDKINDMFHAIFLFKQAILCPLDYRMRFGLSN